MADRFLNSAGGNVAEYTTPANAAITLAGLLAGATVAQDEIVWAKSDSTTVESSTAAVTLTSEGATYASPLKVISTSDWWVDAPGNITPGARLTTTGPYPIRIVGSWCFNGVTFNPGGGGGATSACITYIGYGRYRSRISVGDSHQCFSADSLEHPVDRDAVAVGGVGYPLGNGSGNSLETLDITEQRIGVDDHQ